MRSGQDGGPPCLLIEVHKLYTSQVSMEWKSRMKGEKKKAKEEEETSSKKKREKDGRG